MLEGMRHVLLGDDGSTMDRRVLAEDAVEKGVIKGGARG